jgi:HD-like signal output (HDOD) protein
MLMTDLTPAATDARNALLTRIKNNDVEVPILPEVARKVVMLVNDPESDASQIAKVIESDQSMAANILRIANSPAYTPAGNIVSLQQAISRLGMQTMSEVAIAASVNSKMFNAPGFETRIKQIWDDSLKAGLWAKEVARLTRRNVEAAFLCGLLHNIGRPMLLQWLSESFSNLSEEETLSVEEALFVDANRAVIEAWELPSIVLQGITEYVGEITKLPEISSIVRAGILMTIWGSTPDKDPADIPVHGGALAALNLYKEELETLKLAYNDVNASMEVMRA